MGKLLMHNKLVAVRMLKKIRIKQRLLAEKQKKFEKFILEKMDIAAKQRGSACSECARLQPRVTNKDKFKSLAAKRSRLLKPPDIFTTIYRQRGYCR